MEEWTHIVLHGLTIWVILLIIVNLYEIEKKLAGRDKKDE